MPSLGLRQTAKVGAVQLHREHALPARVPLVRGEVDGLLVDRLHRQNLVVPSFQLALQPGIGPQRILLVKAVQVEMGVAVAPARPQEAVSRLQDPEHIVHLDP